LNTKDTDLTSYVGQNRVDCGIDNKQVGATGGVQPPSLPASARVPINRCNLPAVILGSLTFQRHPTALIIDGVQALHRELFPLLDALDDPAARARLFTDYMTVHFRLDSLEDAGWNKDSRHKRHKADYLRMARGWHFDPNSREGAVLKGWVESRFGLLPRYHNGPLQDSDGDAYRGYLEARATGLYSTNALEAQLDLLYTYCQEELTRQFADRKHLRLYRGVNRLDEYEVLEKTGRRECIVLLNNLNSFTACRERADEFGDYILEADVPLSKIFFFTRLLPDMLKGEDEYVVIGGVYEVKMSLM